MSNCNVLELFNNVTSNCDNDIEVVKDDCEIICLMSIAKALDMFGMTCITKISLN
jgi:hypothetical protein